MRNYFLLLLFYLFILNIKAQNKFEEGYIIKKNGEKINGLILNEDWLGSPKQIVFKPNLESENFSIETNDLQKFVVSNSFVFERFTVDIDRYSKNLNLLDKSRKSNFQKESLLLELLIEGEVSLYKYYTDGAEYFYYTKNNNIFPLEYKVYRGPNNTLSENLNYKKTLRDEFTCKTKINSEFSYKERNFVTFFKKINDCLGKEYIDYTKKDRKDKFNLRGKIGLGFSNSKPPQALESSKKTILKFGLELEYILPFNNNKWALFLDSGYHSFKGSSGIFTGYVTVPSSGATVPSYKKFDFEYRSIENHIGVRHYLFLNTKNKFFINTGVLYDISLNFESEFTASDSNYSTMSIFFGTGYDFNNKINIELRYNSPRDLTRFSSVETIYENFSIKLGYNFL